MRKVVLLAMLIAVGVAGAAYAASVQNKYVIKAKVTPVRAGIVPIGTHLEWVTSTIPAGQRPNVVKNIQFTLSGVRNHAGQFKGCTTSRLNDPSRGPNTCPAGSKIGSGHFTALIGPSGNQGSSAPPCQAELNIYNGVGGTLSFYVYVTKAAGQCPLSQSVAFAGTLHQTKRALIENVQIPDSLQHATLAGVTFDIAATDVVLDVGAKTRVVKKHRVALFESFACPVTRQRPIKGVFTLQNGSRSNPVTAAPACK